MYRGLYKAASEQRVGIGFQGLARTIWCCVVVVSLPSQNCLFHSCTLLLLIPTILAILFVGFSALYCTIMDDLLFAQVPSLTYIATRLQNMNEDNWVQRERDGETNSLACMP